jgi:hypothetical protein
MSGPARIGSAPALSAALGAEHKATCAVANYL